LVNRTRSHGCAAVYEGSLVTLRLFVLAARSRTLAGGSTGETSDDLAFGGPKTSTTLFFDAPPSDKQTACGNRQGFGQDDKSSAFACAVHRRRPRIETSTDSPSKRPTRLVLARGFARTVNRTFALSCRRRRHATSILAPFARNRALRAAKPLDMQSSEIGSTLP